MSPSAQAAAASPPRRPRPLPAVLLASAAAIGAWHLVAAPTLVPRSTVSLRKAPAPTARRAEGEEKGEEGGFLKFLQVEQDIELSPEEYKIALEQEIESQRRKYYIGGDVKANNLIVPWKPVDEKQLEADARRQLKKNGIADPSGVGSEKRDETEDSPISVVVVGEQDVLIEWTQGEPLTKVGYIVERKRPQDANFVEIASYDGAGTNYLLIQPYTGHEYSYNDEIVKPGPYTYRVLCRFRSGEVNVVDQKDITVPELSGVDNQFALIIFLVLSVVIIVGAYLSDPVVS